MSEILIDTTSNTVSSGTGGGGLTLDPTATELVTVGGKGLKLPDGTAAEPAIAWSDDVNTGIFSSANDSVSIATNGIETLKVSGDASGVNYLELKGSATGVDLSIDAVGSDADISIDLSPKGSGTVSVNGTDVSLSTHNHAGVYEPADATILKDADIGVSVQGYDANTAKYNDATANFTGTLQNGGSNVLVDTAIGSTVQAYNANTRTLKDNLAASVAPTTTDDTNSGYAVGSVWIDTTADQSYVCVDSTASAAVWNQIDAAGGGLNNVVEDTTPQLGGMLDVNGNSLGDGTLELLKFSETASAVNELTIANAATGNAPVLSATGDDANVGITLTPKGTGDVTLGTLVFDADQAVGAGTDNHVLTFDNGTGKISLEAAGGGATGYLYTDTPATNPTGTGAGTLVIGDGAQGNNSNNSVVIGDVAKVNTASKNNQVIIGGTALAQGGADCTVVGAYSSSYNDYGTVFGRSASVGAGGSNSCAFGNSASTASTYCTAVGRSAAATGTRSTAVGSSAVAAQWGCVGLGWQAYAFRYGEYNFSNSGISSGKASTSLFTQYVETLDATQTTMGWHYDGGDWTPGTSEIALNNNSTTAFTITIVARRTDADGENAVYKIEGAIKRDGTAASTAIVGSITKTVLAEDTAAWDVTAEANTTNGSLAIKVTGEASKTIRWVATAILTNLGE